MNVPVELLEENVIVPVGVRPEDVFMTVAVHVVEESTATGELHVTLVAVESSRTSTMDVPMLEKWEPSPL